FHLPPGLARCGRSVRRRWTAAFDDGGRHMKIAATLCIVAMALILSSRAVAQTDAPRVERPVWPPQGSTWTVQTKSTGSLASTGANTAGSRTVTWEALGEQDWEGRRVIGLTSGGDFNLYYDASRRIVAQVRDASRSRRTTPMRPTTSGPCLSGSRG